MFVSFHQPPIFSADSKGSHEMRDFLSPLRNAHLPLINDISDCGFKDDNNLRKKRKKNITLERETQISNRYTPDCARI